MKTATKQSASIVIGALWGVGISIILMLILSAILAVMLLNENINEEMIPAAVIVIHIACTLIGCLLSTTLTKRKRVQVCLMTAAGYMLVLILANISLFNASMATLWQTMLTILGTAGAVGFMGLMKKGRSHNQVKKYRFG